MDSNLCKDFENVINENKIVIFGSVGCSACKHAKNLLTTGNYNFLNVDLKDKNEEFNQCIFEKTNSHYIPQVFINKKYIGGYTEVKYLHETKLLEDLVKL